MSIQLKRIAIMLVLVVLVATGAEAVFQGSPAGNPRTIGFWKHQLAVWNSNRGHAQVPASTIESWLPFTVFDVTYESLEDLYAALWLEEPEPMQERAIQQCTATMLNLYWGELSWLSMVDTDGDGEVDSLLYQAIDAAEDAYFAGDYETAKTICDNVNNM